VIPCIKSTGSDGQAPELAITVDMQLLCVLKFVLEAGGPVMETQRADFQRPPGEMVSRLTTTCTNQEIAGSRPAVVSFAAAVGIFCIGSVSCQSL
jgi:hypothetical protein